MNDEMLMMLKLSRQGFNCSQILLKLALLARKNSNPELIRAMQGLGGGLGFSGNVCGALTGGVCLLSLYTGRGRAEEKTHANFHAMIEELVHWFEENVGEEFGSINCRDIIKDDLKTRTINPKCSHIVASTYEKAKEILAEQGMTLGGESL